MSQEEIVKKYRDTIIEGKCIDLVPLKEALLPMVVELRNQKRSRYFLNQSILLTLDMQKDWYNKYLERFDDIYWCIRNKENVMIGTVRLYDITEEACIQGSLIIDEKYSMGMPYALEAEILTIDFAFHVLNVNKVINDDRHDNKMMNSITKKMGFTFEKMIEIDGVPYKYYILEKSDSKTDKYKAILEEFMNR